MFFFVFCGNRIVSVKISISANISPSILPFFKNNGWFQMVSIYIVHKRFFLVNCASETEAT